ncbi:N(G),N(G)-dimethylarginine dimethylaminohydrolase [Rarobacter faecitabidus]|uniref:Dimethylargininase n=1 Tax=Rarobacter faecitabidus TaxID=13243 RepID=A0A542ZAL0_RARFA|nr:dimethylargininase [Rarobacter faecitabidus]TQL57379.1 dimethylargininase [Rarobacter faecitabidus]
MTRVLVRRPSPALAEGELTHFERVPVDYDLALRQWQQYVAALDAAGFAPIELAPADDQPDGVFVEDTVVLLGSVAVLTNPGADSRKGEIDSMANALSDLGFEIHRISAPGTLEGGDVLKIGKTIYVGRSSRTNDEGIRQLAAIGSANGYETITVPVTKTLHLKSQVTALPDGTVIGHPDIVDAPESFATYLDVPEIEGIAVVVVGDDAVLISASAPRTAELLRSRGLNVVETPITEFEKMEGCVTCLSVRARVLD